MTASASTTPSGLIDGRMSLGAAELDDLFPSGEAYRRSTVTYWVLLVLAAFVAAFGLFQDSTASIIGAMVIAPLGGAILAIAGALVTGRTRWQVRTIIQVAVSAVVVIAIGYVVALVIPELIVLTPALEARTEPGLLDLGVALAAGAAGAFVAARHTGSDALPGVAIAVSLVPPLATVGICLEQGRFDDAGGAMILFTTNLAAIIVVASLVFLLSGARPIAEGVDQGRRMRVGVVVATILLVLISLPLVWRSAQNIAAEITALDTTRIVTVWADANDVEVRDWHVDGDQINLIVAGPRAADRCRRAGDRDGRQAGPPRPRLGRLPAGDSLRGGGRLISTFAVGHRPEGPARRTRPCASRARLATAGGPLEPPALYRAESGFARLVGQQATGSVGIRSGPLAGASKKVAMRTVGDPVRLIAEWT